MTTLITVTQGDVEAANEIISGFRKTSGCYYASAKDDHWIAKLVARTRLTGYEEGVAAERARCAGIARDKYANPPGGSYHPYFSSAAESIALAIEAEAGA